MTYEIVLTKRAVKDLEKIEEKMRKRIIEKIKEDNPDPIENARKIIRGIGGEASKISEEVIWFFV